jgi:hypothetical protein
MFIVPPSLTSIQLKNTKLTIKKYLSLLSTITRLRKVCCRLLLRTEYAFQTPLVTVLRSATTIICLQTLNAILLRAATTIIRLRLIQNATLLRTIFDTILTIVNSVVYKFWIAYPKYWFSTNKKRCYALINKINYCSQARIVPQLKAPENLRKRSTILMWVYNVNSTLIHWNKVDNLWCSIKSKFYCWNWDYTVYYLSGKAT